MAAPSLSACQSKSAGNVEKEAVQEAEGGGKELSGKEAGAGRLLQLAKSKAVSGRRRDACLLLLGLLPRPVSPAIGSEALAWVLPLLRNQEMDLEVAKSATQVASRWGLSGELELQFVRALAELWARIDAPERAVEVISAAVNRHPNAAPALLLKTANYAFNGALCNEALQLARMIEERYPACDPQIRVSALMRQPYALGHAGRYNEAIAVFDKLRSDSSLAMSPRQDLVARADRAFYAGHGGDVTAAAQELTACASQTLGMGELALGGELQRRAGLLLEIAGDYSAAAETFRVVWERFGLRSPVAAGDALYRWSECCRVLGDAEGEQYALRTLMTQLPTHWRAAQPRLRLDATVAESVLWDRVAQLQRPLTGAFDSHEKRQRLQELASLYLSLGAAEKAARSTLALLPLEKDPHARQWLMFRLIVLFEETDHSDQARRIPRRLVDENPGSRAAAIAGRWLEGCLARDDRSQNLQASPATTRRSEN